ncbi:MAG: DUF4124 domain-containing protein [Bermanella sp.]
MKFCSIFLLMFSLHSVAEVYTWINENGVKVYGDEPPANATKAELPRLQKLKTLKIPEADKKVLSSGESNADFKGYSELSLLTPKKDQVITAGEASISIQLYVSPPLQAKHEVSLLLDGKIVKTAAQLNFQLDNVSRGSHLLQAKIKYNGQLLMSSPKRRIHVQRPSILNRSSTR